MFGRLGTTELLVILGIALLLFGSRLPGVGKALGEGIRNFKKGIKGADEDDAASTAAQPGSSPSTQNATARTASQNGQTGSQGTAGAPIQAQTVWPQPLQARLENGSQTQGQRTGQSTVVDVDHRDAPKS